MSWSLMGVKGLRVLSLNQRWALIGGGCLLHILSQINTVFF